MKTVYLDGGIVIFGRVSGHHGATFQSQQRSIVDFERIFRGCLTEGNQHCKDNDIDRL